MDTRLENKDGTSGQFLQICDSVNTNKALKQKSKRRKRGDRLWQTGKLLGIVNRKIAPSQGKTPSHLQHFVSHVAVSKSASLHDSFQRLSHDIVIPVVLPSLAS